MKKPLAPCKDCTNRCVGCHIVCDKYIQFSHEMELFRKEKQRIQEENRILNEIETRRKMLTIKGGFRRKKK